MALASSQRSELHKVEAEDELFPDMQPSVTPTNDQFMQKMKTSVVNQGNRKLTKIMESRTTI